jgi:DNA-3-methyladenine glycosylase
MAPLLLMYRSPAMPPRIRRLSRSELPLETTALARFLLGKIVVRELAGETLAGRVVETEAYLVGDPACHAFRGPTPRNRALFMERGHAYVYIAYGTSLMLNVSSEHAGIGAGVLIRALEPIDGVRRMERHRGVSRLRDLTRGPGRLASALRVTLALDGVDLCAPGPLWLGDDVRPVGSVGSSTRIGITKAADRMLRFYERGNPFVSGPRKLSP